MPAILSRPPRSTRPGALRAIAQGQGWLSLIRGVRISGLTAWSLGIPRALGLGYREPDKDEAVYFLRPIAFFVRAGLQTWWHAIGWLWRAGFLNTADGKRMNWRHFRPLWWRVWMARAIRWKKKDYEEGRKVGFEMGRAAERLAWVKALEAPPPTSFGR